MERINEESPLHENPVENRENDDEEEENDDDHYDYGDGFLDDGAEEEEDEEQRPCSEKKSRNRRRKDEDFSLDEDDYMLLEDNNANFQKRKFKRLKKSSEETDGSGIRISAEHKNSETLFHDHDNDDEEEKEDDEIELNDLSDFIVEEDSSHGMRKKRILRHGTDINAFQYAKDLFGDTEELLKLRKKDLAYNKDIKRKLKDEFEPIVLFEKYMTEKDDEIRKLDVPERIQISEHITGVAPVDEVNIEEESNWIYARLKHEQGLGFLVNKDDIVNYLKLYHVQKLELPFIAMYRKEQCRSLLYGSDDDGEFNLDKKLETKWHKFLWMVQDLDRRWLLLRKRKIGLFGYYTKCFEEETCRSDLNQSLFESVMKSLEAAETEREVDDVDSKFNLHFPRGEIDEGQYKRPNRKSQYSICRKYGLWEVANKFGYSAEQLGLALSLEKVVFDELEDVKETPEEMALNYVCEMFVDPQAVLRGARHVAAIEISCEPSIKRYVRGIFMENAVVSTSPTPDGNVVIDSFHQFSAVKWLREKPLSKFDGAQWLLIQEAEEEKLLQVTFKLPENQMNRLICECSEHYLSVGVSKYAQLWNEERKLILEDVVHCFLLPSMEKEARSLLTSRAKNWLLSEYGHILWKKVSSGPYRKKINRSDEETVPRVLACCWGPGNPETTFVMLDSMGELLDVLYGGSISLRSRDVNDQQRKKMDQDRLLKFMRAHKPDVVALGAVSLSCLRLKDEIYEVIFKLVEEMAPDEDDKIYDIPVVYADESLPRLYENSRISSEQLPQQSRMVKRAVALGRYLQNPLAMIAALCGSGKEILSWKLHSLQDFLDPDEKYEMVEQVMVDITNQVGIDINLAASHEWLFSPLQFVSGLGPRKAASLQRSLVRAGSIFVRKELINHGLGKKVFVNAAGFLRIRRSGLACSSSQCIDLLDDTRIHPESYGLTQELAKDVYAIEGGEDDAIEMAIEHVREQPASLKKIVLDEYLRSKNQENKKETYSLIMRELSCGFQDWRSLFKEVDKDEEFYMISGETEETIGEGRVVQATVQRVTSGKAICVLDCGLPGILVKEDYSDDGRDIVDMSSKLCEGDIVTCKIKSIQKHRYSVFLVCKESEMRKNMNLKDIDDYYHEENQNCVLIEKEKISKEKKQFKPRMIVHPRFQNITTEQAKEYLSDKNIGECIVRPSSRGLNYLTLMIKIFDNVYANKEIIEGEKKNKDIVSLQRIGKTLKIENETFEDLDEVMDRYVDPLVTHLRTMLNYRKFRTGTKSEIDDLLRVEKSVSPKMVVYGFGVSHEHPGSFVLSYIRSTNPHHEYIGLYPKGFKFRKRMFGDLDRLVAYFQRHIDDGQDHC